MEADNKVLLSPVNGKFTFQKHQDGTADRSTVLRDIRSKEFFYQSSLKMSCQQKKHLAANLEVRRSLALDANVSNRSRQVPQEHVQTQSVSRTQITKLRKQVNSDIKQLKFAC